MKYIFFPCALANVILFVYTIWNGLVYDRIAHFKWGLGTTIATLFVHSLAIIYFLLVFRALKEVLEKELEQESEYLEKGRAFLKSGTLLATGGMLLAIITALAGGAVDARMMGRHLHTTLVVVNVTGNTYLFWMIYRDISRSASFVQKVDRYLEDRANEREES